MLAQLKQSYIVPETQQKEPVLTPKRKRGHKKSSDVSTVHKDPELKQKYDKKTEPSAEHEHLASIRTAENSVAAALIPRNIESAWISSKLKPFTGTIFITRRRGKGTERD